MRLKNGLRVLVYGSALFLLLWAFWLEPSSLRVTAYDLPLQQWPAQQAGLRIAVISDIHAGAPYITPEKLQQIVALNNAAAPDLVLLAGDYIIHEVLGGHDIEPDVTARILGDLRAPLGVYAVLGNHDVWPDQERIVAAFEHNGIVLMDNRLKRIASASHQFWLAGFGNFRSGSPNVRKTLSRVNDDAPVIGFTHNPALYELQPAPMNLRIAGHTHGGQGNFPLLGRIALRLFPERSRYEAGHYRDPVDVFVSTGIGTSGLPVRFRVPPEISLLTLQPDHE